MNIKNWKRSKILLTVLIGTALILAYMIFNPKLTGNAVRDEMLKVTVTRLIGGIIFVILMCYMGYGRILKLKGRGSRYLPVLPFLLVVVNNLPIVGLFTGNVYLEDKSALSMILFASESLMIGFFEEVAFRGTLFMYVLEDRRDTRKKIFWVTVITSGLFGLVHLLNLIEGGSPLSVILQIGYSFLIGGMCAVTLLLTKNIWTCIMLHTIFDFCGKMIPTLGDGLIWDGITVTITAVLAILTIIHALAVMKHIKTADADLLYEDKEKVQ